MSTSQLTYHLNSAIDWVSFKLNLLVLPVLFLGNPVLVWMGYLATLSTILYNGIRIYKELKNKENK